MIKLRNLFIISTGLLTALTTVCVAETYHLSSENRWQNTDASEEGQYLLSMSRVKQQIMSGSKTDAVAALEQLKQEFPSLAGEPFDAYLEAERYYAQEKWYKAATRYSQFADTWPDSPLQPAALERIFSIATAYLQGQKRTFIKVLKLPAFDTGAELMHNLADRAGNAPIALRALTTLAENQEKKEKYLDAYQTWAEISDRWPTGEAGQLALMRMAQTLHASYDGTEYDASVLESARTYFEDFINRYGEERAAEFEIPETLEMINEQLAYKTYQMGFYYERTGSMEAAEVYYNKVLNKWPDSDAAKMAAARLADDAAPPVKKTVRRKAFNGMSTFLDRWFGLRPLFGSGSNDNSTEEKGQ